MFSHLAHKWPTLCTLVRSRWCGTEIESIACDSHSLVPCGIWTHSSCGNINSLKAKLRGFHSASEIYHVSDRRWPANFSEILRIEGYLLVNEGVPHGCYVFFQVASHLSSRGCVDPVPDPLLPIKSGRAGNRTRDLWACSRYSDHYTTEAIYK
jgi:hypothetical protein